MHLLFDGQALQSPSSKGRGIGRYANSLLAALRPARPDWRISVLELAHLPPIDRDRLPGGLEFERLDLPLLPLTARAHRWLNDRAYGDWLADHPADAYLSAHSFDGDAVHPLFGKRRPPSFVVLYDLIPQRFDDIYLSSLVYRDFYGDRLRQTCAADVLLAISDWTARDYEELQPVGPARVATIGGAPDPHFQPLDAQRLGQIEIGLRDKFGLAGEFILNPSGQCWRKNSRGALLAYAQLPDAVKRRYDFVVACKINRAEENELRRLANQHGIHDRLRLTGFVSDDELVGLYQLCRVCVFPSFYEGLGLPVVEALQCGAPVVTSDCSSLPEFAGPHSFLGDPSDNASLSKALEAALREPRAAHQAERIAFARKFSWASVAERTALTIEEQVDQPYSASPRPRLAWVTAAWPGSPEMERVEQLVGELLHRFEVEIVVPDAHPGVSAAFNCQVSQVRAFELRERNRVSPFAYFLYDCTSAAALPFLMELAQNYPGLLFDEPASDAAGPALWPARLPEPGQSDGFLARAVSSASRWAELRPRFDAPLFFIDSSNPSLHASGRTAAILGSTGLDSSTEGDLAAPTIMAARLAAALESLGVEPVMPRLRAA